MNLNHLLHFCAVARTGSYTRAAEEAGVSEPVVHQAVKSLERNCGLKLVQRRGKRIYPTPEGEVILGHATRIAYLADITEQAVAEQKGNVSGRLSIGVSTVVVLSFLPAILAEWAPIHPLVKFSIAVGLPNELEDDLLRDRLDLLVSAGTKWSLELKTQFVFNEQVVVVSAPEHPLAKHQVVSIADLSREKIILGPVGGSTRNEVDDLQYRYRVEFRSVVEVNRMDAVKPLCKAGLGVAVMPKSMVAQEISNNQLALLNVESFPRPRPYWLVYRADRVATPEMKSFLYAVQLWIEGKERGGSVMRPSS